MAVQGVADPFRDMQILSLDTAKEPSFCELISNFVQDWLEINAMSSKFEDINNRLVQLIALKKKITNPDLIKFSKEERLLLKQELNLDVETNLEAYKQNALWNVTELRVKLLEDGKGFVEEGKSFESEKFERAIATLRSEFQVHHAVAYLFGSAIVEVLSWFK